MTYATDPADAAVSSTGWIPLGGSGLLVTAEPLRDMTSDLYARLTYREALDACARVGGRLPTAAEVDAIRDDALAAGGCLLSPITLPDADLLRAAGISQADEHAVAAFLNSNMASEAWCRIHDERAAAQLLARGWDGKRPAMNLGKWYIDGAPAGRAWLQGWWLLAAREAPAHYIQAGHEAPGQEGPHDDMGSRDYGTLTMVVCDAGLLS